MPLKLRSLTLTYLISLIVIICFSCNDACDDLDKKIDEALVIGNDITKKEFSELENYIRNNKIEIQKCNSELILGEEVNQIKLENLIKSGTQYKILSRSSYITLDKSDIYRSLKKASTTIIPKLYLERSGSMVFYDKSVGKGQFKTNLVKMLNKFDLTNPEKSLVYIVNDAVYDFNMSFKEFIRLDDVFAATSKVGSSTYTDFDEIFRTLTQQNEENELSIFVSDFIYSTKKNGEKNPIRISSEIEGLMTNVFNSVSKEYSFLIAKFYGDYNGTYYDYKNAKISYNGLRPYYIGFFAKNETMNQFLSDINYSRITKFDNYEQFQNFYLFSTIKTGKRPDYTILIQDSSNKGRFRQSSDEMKLRNGIVTKLDNVAPDKLNNEFKLSIALDLSQFLIDDDYIKNVSNYRLSSTDFEILSVEPSDAFEDYTHKIRLTKTEGELAYGKLSISLLNTFPKWIEKSSTLDDQNIKEPDFERKTFALEGMMQGIYKAYYKELDEPKYFEIDIELNK